MIWARASYRSGNKPCMCNACRMAPYAYPAGFSARCEAVDGWVVGGRVWPYRIDTSVYERGPICEDLAAITRWLWQMDAQGEGVSLRDRWLPKDLPPVTRNPMVRQSIDDRACLSWLFADRTLATAFRLPFGVSGGGYR